MRKWSWLVVPWLVSFCHASAQQTWAVANDLIDSSVWSAQEFQALWRHDREEKPFALTRGYLLNPPWLAGIPVQAATARFLGGEVDSLSVVILDAGEYFGFAGANVRGMSAEQARKAFDEEFARYKSRLLVALESMAAKAPVEFQPGERRAFHSKALLFRHGNVWSRVMAVDHQLLMIDFFRSESAARSLKSSALPPSPATNPLSTHDSEGDHVITGIPMVHQGNRGYCGVATLAMIGQFLGLQPGAEEYAALAGFQYGETKSPDIRELCSRVAQEAGVRATRAERFDFNRARASIDLGLPVLTFRRWSAERDYVHTLYSGRLARGETGASLPAPTMEDRHAWPGKDAPAHASVVHGYNLQKREVIFSESWGEPTRGRRMRAEELEGTSYYAVYFTR